ncbi:hypothetical protein N9Q02_00825 [bacterium]|nr:hypothetical protein [bacterium]
MATVIRGDDNFDTGTGRSNVVQTHVITTSSQSVSSMTITDITGLTATITPKFTSSKIMVDVRWSGEGSAADNYEVLFGIRRNGTDIGNPAAAGNRQVGMAQINMGYHSADSNSTPDSCIYSYLDSPSSTSQLTYTATVISNPATTLYNNRTVSNNDSASFERLTSSITLTEVQG